MKKIISIFITCLLIVSAIMCSVVMAKNALGKEPTLFGMRCFYLVSGSMEPTIKTGAAVIVRKNSDGIYEKNDVITFSSTDQSIYGQPNTHRIVEVSEENGEYTYVTKGDANPVADTEPVTSDRIYGKVIWHTGSAQWVGSLLGLITTPMGFLTVIMIPILAIAVVMLREFTKEYKKALESAAIEAAKEDEE